MTRPGQDTGGSSCLLECGTRLEQPSGALPRTHGGLPTAFGSALVNTGALESWSGGRSACDEIHDR
jgi:hypothetical protein